jgi:serine/threonine protein kinase/Tol biopolymer transport system component
MPLPTGSKLGHYEIIAAIGAGGMGEVYRAADTRLKRQVAIKILPSALALDPDRMSRFEREARLLASLDHANIGAIYGIEESDGAKALILALIEGPTLADRIATGPIPPDEAIPLARQMAEAIEYAHDRGVIHRDLKPANVKITPEGAVKVLDFGLAKALSGESDDYPSPSNSPTFSPTLSIRATQAGMILGTAAYMAPEQAKGKAVDRRADIWAFGVVFFEMLTGNAPFNGDTAAEIIASTLKEEPNLDRLPPGTPPAIRRLIQRCLHKDPKRRLQAIGEARIALSDPLEGPAAAGLPEARPAPAVSRSGWLPWAVAGLLLAITAGTLFFHFRETRPTLVRGRFQLVLEGSRFRFWSLSPDGRAAAYTSGDAQGGTAAISIRYLDSLQPRLLPGTEGASYPFWSPDGEYLGFFAQGKLKKIALAGGPPQTICDAPTGRGGSWNRDGVIVFSPVITGGLCRVSADGGAPVQLTTTGRFPEFIQGSKRFLALNLDGRGGLSATSIDGGAPTPILQDSSRAIYVPPPAGDRLGHLLFVRGTTLMAQPFDAAGLAVKGNAIALAENIGQSGNVGYGGFAASENGVLLTATNDASELRTIKWLDRSGKVLESIGEPLAYLGMALAPDGKRLATAVIRNGSDIWIQDLQRGLPAKFTFTGNVREPTWSPRGDFLVFATRTFSADFYRKRSNGEGSEELLFRAGSNGLPSDISPDGKWLVYSQEGDKTKDDLLLLPLEGERKPVVYLESPFNERGAQFSPDGKWMAYSSDESGRFQVYVQPIPATGAKRQVSTNGGGGPRWRRDGTELFYRSADAKLMAVPVARSASGFDFGAPRQLFDTSLPVGGREFGFQPSPDGQRFLAPLDAEPGTAAQPRIEVQINWQSGLKPRN